MGCRGTACLSMICSTGLQGNLCSGAWSTASPYFFTDLGVCKVVSLTYSPPSCSFFPLLKYVITEVLPPLLMGLALASGGSVLELAGTGSVGHGGKLLAASRNTTPVASCWQNLATQTRYTGLLEVHACREQDHLSDIKHPNTLTRGIKYSERHSTKGQRSYHNCLTKKNV